ncbi:MAG: hypothetical protein ACOCUL_00090 [Bacteroidota bacterium]
MTSENNKRIAKNTGMLYIRMMLTMLISLYTSRIVLKILGIEDYGIYNVVAGIVTMFSFMNNALGTSTSRFLTFELGKEDFPKLKKVFRSAFSIHVLFAIIIFILLETIGLWFINNKLVIPSERLYAANWIYQFSIINSVIRILQVPLTASIIAHERMNIYAWLGIFDVVMKLIVVLLLSYSGIDKLITYGFLLAVISGLLFTIYHFYCKKKFVEYNLQLIFEKPLLKEMLNYSGWSFIGSFANIMKLQGINIILNIFFGPAVNAARGVAYQVNHAVNSFTQSFTIAINPQIIKNYASGDISTMMILLVRGVKFSYFLLLILGLPIILEAEFILNLWLVEVPKFAVIFTRLVIINSLLESFTFVLGASIQATGKIKWYQIMVGGFLLMNLPVSYLFLKMGYPPQTTLIISIILAFFALMLRIILIKMNIPRFPVKEIFNKVFLVAVIVTVIAISAPLYILNSLETGWTRFVIISVAGFITTSIAIWIFGLNKNERTFIFNYILKKQT